MIHPNIDKFLRSYCSNNNLREKLIKPNYYDNGYVVASDSHILTMFYDPNFDKNDCHNSKLDAWGVLGVYSNIYEGKESPIGTIKTSQMEAIFENIQKTPEYKEKYRDCKDCDGYGKIECDCCGQESDCKGCDGDGSILCGKEETGYYIFPENEIFVINDVWLGLPTTYSILQSLKLIDADELEIYQNRTFDKVFYKVKGMDVYILQMGVLKYENDNEKIKHIIKVI